MSTDQHTSLLALTDRRYVGQPCHHHPDCGGVRYKSNHRCVVCVAVARDEWKLKHPQRVQKQVKKYKSKNRDILNAAERRRRRAKKGLPIDFNMKADSLKPSAWIRKWEEDHPGHKLTTEDIADYLATKSDVVHSYRRKVNAERMAAWRAKKQKEGGANDLVRTLQIQEP